MPNKPSGYLAAFITVTGMFIALSASKPSLAQNLPSGTDQGYSSLPRAFVDANGDGRVDYCRFVGDPPNIFIACVLGTSNGFDVANQLRFRSISGIDQGYGNRPRGFRDANGDGKADYCRFVGDAPNIYETCNLATSTGFDSNQHTYRPIGFQACNRSSTRIDVAYATKRMGKPNSFGSSDTITESQGWWVLASGECRVVYSGDASDVVGVYAQGGGRIWSSNDLPQFCIHPTNRFTFGSEANNSSATCRDQGGSSVGFINVRSPESSRTFTFGN